MIDEKPNNTPMTGSPELGVKLHEWHGGQASALYAVGSCWYAGTTAPLHLVREAAEELGALVRAGRRCKNLEGILLGMIAKAEKR
jgi:hypothetical protein